MKTFRWIYEQGSHRWGVCARDPQRAGNVIDTNEYLVTQGEAGLLCDPGGTEIFPAVFAAISREFSPTKIRHIFASHQDPDIASSLVLWLEANPSIKCLVSWLWSNFISHFGAESDVFIKIPDEGMSFMLGTLNLQIVPAHYLHSSGNFNVYDAKAKILFSGDIGAALLPTDADLWVNDFDDHLRKGSVVRFTLIGNTRVQGHG